MTAQTLNDHLKNGGVVQITTYMHSTLYQAKHAGMFFDRDGSMFVKQGRGSVKLTIGDRALVGIRLGRMVG